MEARLIEWNMIGFPVKVIDLGRMVVGASRLLLARFSLQHPLLFEPCRSLSSVSNWQLQMQKSHPFQFYADIIEMESMAIANLAASLLRLRIGVMSTDGSCNNHWHLTRVCVSILLLTVDVCFDINSNSRCVFLYYF